MTRAGAPARVSAPFDPVNAKRNIQENQTIARLLKFEHPHRLR
jgi:hypothetical protein